MIWKRVILSWMTLLTLVFASAGATAAADVGPKTHVGAIDVVAAICIEASGLASAEEHRGNWDAATTEASDVPHAARAVPTLATGTGRQMLGQGLNILKATPAEGRVAAMRQLIPQIQARATGGAWSATEMAGANGARAWVGETHTLVIDSAGKVFSGSHVGGAAQFGVVEGQLGVTSWSGLKLKALF